MAELTIRYMFFAGIAWLLGYAWFKRRWFHRKIIAHYPASSEVWREVRYSALSVVIFAMVGVVSIFAIKKGWSQMYWKLNQHGWLWFVATIVAAVLLHDTYFYWTHRLMHHRKLFRLFHRVHHLSRNPTPWRPAYAFSPLEAFVVEACIFPLTAFLIPINPWAFGIFMVWQIAFNVAGHTGYEYNPRWLMESWWGRFINTLLPTTSCITRPCAETTASTSTFGTVSWARIMRTTRNASAR